MIDLLVAGGGPVGLATALYANHAGLTVRVFEPRTGVIDKACGEGLMPGAVARLHDLGVDPPGHPVRGIRYLAGNRQVTAGFRNGDGRGVRRTALHRALLEAAGMAGVSVVPQAVTTIAQDESGVRVDGMRARYLVAADGLHSPLRRLLGLEGTKATARRYGLRQHVGVAPWTDHVEVYWSDRAEAYVTPVDDDVIGVALLTGDRGAFAQQLARFPDLRQRLTGAAVSSVRGAGPLHQPVRRRVAGRVLLVGDAAGYVDALTGEGIALGLAQARAAAAAVAADTPQRYAADWQRITWRYRVITGGLLGATRSSPMRRGLVPAAAALPGVFTAAVNQLTRSA